MTEFRLTDTITINEVPVPQSILIPFNDLGPLGPALMIGWAELENLSANLSFFDAVK